MAAFLQAPLVQSWPLAMSVCSSPQMPGIHGDRWGHLLLKSCPHIKIILFCTPLIFIYLFIYSGTLKLNHKYQWIYDTYFLYSSSYDNDTINNPFPTKCNFQDLFYIKYCWLEGVRHWPINIEPTSLTICRTKFELTNFGMLHFTHFLIYKKHLITNQIKFCCCSTTIKNIMLDQYVFTCLRQLVVCNPAKFCFHLNSVNIRPVIADVDSDTLHRKASCPSWSRITHND